MKVVAKHVDQKELLSNFNEQLELQQSLASLTVDDLDEADILLQVDLDSFRAQASKQVLFARTIIDAINHNTDARLVQEQVNSYRECYKTQMDHYLILLTHPAMLTPTLTLKSLPPFPVLLLNWTADCSHHSTIQAGSELMSDPTTSSLGFFHQKSPPQKEEAQGAIAQEQKIADEDLSGQ